MNQGNKLIAKNTGILFVRLVSTSLLGLFTARFIIEALGVSDFGLYSVVGGMVIVMSFLSTVMTSTTYRFLAVEIGKGENGNANKVFNISLVIHICLAIILLCVTETFGEYYVRHHLNVDQSKLHDALYVLRLSSIATSFSIVSIPYQGLITAEEKFKSQAIIEIIRSAFSFILAFGLLTYAGNRLRIYALLVSIINILPSLMFIFYSFLKFNHVVRWNFQKTFRDYKEMVSYTGWLIFGSLGWVGQRQGSDLLANSFFGTTINATMGIATQVNSMVMVLAKNLGLAAIPQITKSVSSNDSNRTKFLVAYISKYTYFLMLIPALPLLLETEYILNLWLVKYPSQTVFFCQLIIINALVETLSTGLPSVIMATGKVKIFMIIGGMTSIIGLPITYFLYKAGAPPYSVLIVYIGTGILNLVFSQVLLRKIIQYDILFFLKTAYLRVFFVLISLIPLFFLRDIFYPGIFRLFFFSGFSFLWLFVSIYVLGIEKHERIVCYNTLSGFIKKIFR